METRVDEIAGDIYRLSTLVPEVAPGGFSFNQFVVKADEPLLFHCGPRQMFPLVSEAAARIVPLDQFRWITFGHVESDECGSMNEWLAVAPRAEVAHGATGVLVSLNDMCDRQPRILEDGEVIDLGGKRVRHFDTPHVPHNWEARVLHEETTSTLLCGDIGTMMGDGPATIEDDIVPRALETEDVFLASSMTPALAPTIRKLAELQPSTLAIMHGPSFKGDGAGMLHALADAYAKRLAEAGVEEASSE
ncbi:MAG TPA: MBL fold metallo-hydrolase [Acidimicrobiia bacterium]|jgi:flavorubredoxin